MKETASFTAASPRRRVAGPLPALLKRVGERIRYGTLLVRTPGGDQFEFGGVAANEPYGVWEIGSWTALWSLLTRGATGLAESYLDGRWDSPDLTALLRVAAVNERALGACAAGSPLLLWGDRLRHRLRANSPRQARKNIAYHYDLGNAFYALWLDETMTYSAALFDRPGEALEVAQTRKYSHLAELAGVTAADKVLEIGCGWGGFLDYAAGTLGAEVTGISISRAQVDYARARIAGRGLEQRAQVELRDYRDLDGSFDRIVSIEMFEAVGEAYWDSYARQVKRLLAPHGTAGLQVITIADDRFDQYRRTPDFIQRYVFPGGMLPTKNVLTETFARAGLAVTASHAFGRDYARTLARWRERFDAAWPQIAALGFDERFRRLWHFYLGYCEAGFLSDAVDVVQIRLEHVR
jgi:cyclopropane-fatty-acyl-phospholipid synthase